MYFVRSPVVSKDSGQASADAEEAWWQVARGAVLRFFEAFLEVRLGILAWSKKSCNMHLRCLLRYVLSNNWISISIKYCNFTFANGLQICVDASTSARILALAGEAQDNLAIQEVSQMAPFGLGTRFFKSCHAWVHVTKRVVKHYLKHSLRDILFFLTSR